HLKSADRDPDFNAESIAQVESAIRDPQPGKVGEALGNVLRKMNKAYYRWHPNLVPIHMKEMDKLYHAHYTVLNAIRQKNLWEEPLENPTTKCNVVLLFEAFRSLLGPTGASKALHFL